jgi:hypothetical protein
LLDEMNKNSRGFGGKLNVFSPWWVKNSPDDNVARAMEGLQVKEQFLNR